MTWDALKTTLIAALEKLSNAPRQRFQEKLVPAHGKQETETTESHGRIRYLAAQFSEHQTWPSLSDQERLVLSERLRFAVFYAEVNDASGISPMTIIPRNSDLAFTQQAFLWMITDLWKEATRPTAASKTPPQSSPDDSEDDDERSFAA